MTRLVDQSDISWRNVIFGGGLRLACLEISGMIGED